METMSLFPVDLIRVKTVIIKTGQGKIMIGMKKIKQKYKYNNNLVELHRKKYIGPFILFFNLKTPWACPSKNSGLKIVPLK